MPEHFHLLITEPEMSNPSVVMKVIKQRFARRVNRLRKRPAPAEIALRDSTPDPVWQKRFYDFNIWTGGKLTEKLEYMHMNPVKRNLVSHPKDWPWSSWSYYATGEKGLIGIER